MQILCKHCQDHSLYVQHILFSECSGALSTEQNQHFLIMPGFSFLSSSSTNFSTFYIFFTLSPMICLCVSFAGASLVPSYGFENNQHFCCYCFWYTSLCNKSFNFSYSYCYNRSSAQTRHSWQTAKPALKPTAWGEQNH